MATELESFYVTFGRKYSDGSHHRGDWIHPDGYVLIEAESYGEARDLAFKEFGHKWAFIYFSLDFNDQDYPRGQLARITSKPVLVKSDEV